MAFKINHIHIKSADPKQSADWFGKAFDFTVISDETRIFGDRFIRCNSGDGGLIISISNARTGETLGPGDAGARYGLEHFAVESDDIDADIARLVSLGAKFQEGPTVTPQGVKFAFIEAPGAVRVELLQLPKKV